MGGLGSGRTSWHGALDQRIAVDVRDFERRGLLKHRRFFTWVWSIDGRETSRISVYVGDNDVTLDYSCRRSGEEWRPIKETVGLSTTPCHLGGHRVWFLCPRCYRRSAKLYFAVPYFLCRNCCSLPYASQQESPRDRANRKAQSSERSSAQVPPSAIPFGKNPRACIAEHSSA